MRLIASSAPEQCYPQAKQGRRPSNMLLQHFHAADCQLRPRSNAIRKRSTATCHQTCLQCTGLFQAQAYTPCTSLHQPCTTPLPGVEGVALRCAAALLGVAHALPVVIVEPKGPGAPAEARGLDGA